MPCRLSASLRIPRVIDFARRFSPELANSLAIFRHSLSFADLTNWFRAKNITHLTQCPEPWLAPWSNVTRQSRRSSCRSTFLDRE